MYLYITIIVIFILLLIAFTLEKSFFSPAVIITISYLFSMILIVPNVDIWNIHLKAKTCYIVIIGIVSFLIGFFMYSYMKKNKVKKQSENKYYKLSCFSKLFIIMIQIITLVLNFYYVSKIV